jgi:hypothetical protein
VLSKQYLKLTKENSMSFSSRALLGGVATGFLKANNDRRDRMTTRMQELAENTAVQARERAKTALSVSQTNAQAENDKIKSLRAEGAIDDNDMYKESYWVRQSQSDWKEFGEPSGVSHKDYIENTYKKGKPKGVVREYKSSAEINKGYEDLQAGISANLSNDLNKNAATGLDRFLGKSLRKATGTPEEVQTASEPLPQFNPMLPEGAPVGSYESTGDGALPGAPAKNTTYTTFRNAIESDTGEVLSNVFTATAADGTISNVQLQEDGTYKPVNVTARPTTEEGELNRNKNPKLNKVQQEGLARYDRNDRVQLLATELAKNEYVGNPKDFVFRNLATIRDVVGATFNFTGDQNADLENMVNFFNDKLDTQELKDAMGSLSAAAVIKGEVDATTRFLTFATADLYSEGGRLTVTSITAAKETIDSFISGTLSQDARLSALANQGQTEMSRITMNHLSEVRDDFSNPLWNSYPNVKSTLESGALMAPSVAAGMELSKTIKRMEKDNPSAYAQSISNLKQHIGSTDLSVLEKPVFVHRKLGVPVVITYKKNPEGVYNFRLTPIK